MALAFVMLAISSESSELFAIDAIVMGVSIAAVSAVGPVFIVGARLSQEVEAKQLTTYSIMMLAGQLAEIHTTVALEARSNVGNYTLATVVFAVVLFLAGLSRQFKSRPVSIGLGIVSVVLPVIGVGALIVLPTLL